MDWLSLLKDFQTAIVGAIGFFGVAWTLKQNAKLAREQHELERQSLRNAVLAANAAELHLSLRVFERMKEYIEKEFKADEKQPAKRFPKTQRILPSHTIPELGVLSSIEIQWIATSHELIDSTNALIETVTQSTSERHLDIDAAVVEVCSEQIAVTVKRLRNIVNGLSEEIS